MQALLVAWKVPYQELELAQKFSFALDQAYFAILERQRLQKPTLQMQLELLW
jgi:hypothetical protein